MCSARALQTQSTVQRATQAPRYSRHSRRKKPEWALSKTELARVLLCVIYTNVKVTHDHANDQPRHNARFADR